MKIFLIKHVIGGKRKGKKTFLVKDKIDMQPLFPI